MEKAYAESKLCKQIMKSREIKENSCRTYLGSLRKIKKEMTGDNTSIDSTDFLKDFALSQAADTRSEIDSPELEILLLMLSSL